MSIDVHAADELLTTTRAVRKRLDMNRPVSRQVVEECLTVAMQAPTGSNRQHWRWVVVTDADTRKALADIYRRGAGNYLATAQEQALAVGDKQTAVFTTPHNTCSTTCTKFRYTSFRASRSTYCPRHLSGTRQ